MEIKCRGKRIGVGSLHDVVNENGWVYGHYFEMDTYAYIITKFAEMDRYEEYRLTENKWHFSETGIVEVHPESIGVWTGKEDVSGDEIYANHRLRFAIFDHNGLDTQYVGTVRFFDGEWQLWNCNTHNGAFGNDGPFSLYWVMSQYDECLISGYDTDSPELLEVKK